jgi:hypothetical protein
MKPTIILQLVLLSAYSKCQNADYSSAINPRIQWQYQKNASDIGTGGVKKFAEIESPHPPHFRTAQTSSANPSLSICLPQPNMSLGTTRLQNFFLERVTGIYS